EACGVEDNITPGIMESVIRKSGLRKRPLPSPLPASEKSADAVPDTFMLNPAEIPAGDRTITGTDWGACSKGTCAFICPGETYVSGTSIPPIETDVDARELGRGREVAAAVESVRPLP